MNHPGLFQDKDAIIYLIIPFINKKTVPAAKPAGKRD
jgi:hypothetical protein